MYPRLYGRTPQDARVPPGSRSSMTENPPTTRLHLRAAQVIVPVQATAETRREAAKRGLEASRQGKRHRTDD
jgi:hypothetical protein